MKQLITSFKSIYSLAASIGVIIPGFSFFFNYAPPLFNQIAILTSALSIAVIVYISNSDINQKRAKAMIKKYTWRSVKLLAVSFLLILVYLVMIDFTTIVPQEFPNERWQVGFDLETWSLTKTGYEMVADNTCGQGKASLLSCAALQHENITLVWTPLSVYSAGLILIILFTVSSLLWTAGWTLLAKSQILNKQII